MDNVHKLARPNHTIAGLLAAGGMEVKAIKADTSVDGVIGVNAVVYNFEAEFYNKNIVAIAFIGDAIVGESVTRSIYSVAKACLADATATDVAHTFSQTIVDTVENAQA